MPDEPIDELSEARRRREAQQAFTSEAARADYNNAVGQQIRAHALQCAVQHFPNTPEPHFDDILERFEDYLRNGRD